MLYDYIVLLHCATMVNNYDVYFLSSSLKSFYYIYSHNIYAYILIYTGGLDEDTIAALRDDRELEEEELMMAEVAEHGEVLGQRIHSYVHTLLIILCMYYSIV